MSLRDTWKSRIRLLLGGSILKLEVSDQDIDETINIAYDKIKPYITDDRYITKPWARVIDLSEDGVEDVIRVLRGTDGYNSVSEKMFDFEAVKLDRRSLTRAVIGAYPLIDEEVKFKYTEGKLYLDVGSSYSGAVTVQAIVTPKVEDLKDERARTWIFDYALALSKQICGRIRSKYKSGNIPVELDGDTLLSEAATELERLDTELQDRQFGPLYYFGDNKS